VIERLVSRLIDHLDEQDGDGDLEDDDPAEECGDREPDFWPTVRERQWRLPLPTS
jgi:hypothetical protein